MNCKNIFHICFRDSWLFMVVPTGAIVAALFSFSCGIVFVSQILEPNSIASMRPMFEFAAWLMILLCPAITMRLIAEERRVGTWELLLSLPITSFELAKGKFLSALLILTLILVATFPLVLVLELYSSVDYGAVASGYLGLFLLGSAVIGTGLVISALTTSQTVAYLVTAFIWLTLSLSTKVLPSYVPTNYADIIFAFDPDLRTAAFSIGLIDSANIVFFISIAILMGWIAVVSINRTRGVSSSAWKIVLCSILLLTSIIAINAISLNDNYRVRIDATGSRSYTLSQQTSNLLDEIENPWKIVLLVDDSKITRPVLQQVDEVLRRYTEGSEHISVQRINPANPNSIEQYNLLLLELINLYGDELLHAETEINNGIAQFSLLMTFGSSTSAWAESLLEIQSTKDEQETLRALSSALALLGSEGGLILDEVDKAMRVDESQPLPQLALSRDILVAAMGQWSRELAEVAGWLSQERSDSIATICANEVPSFELMAMNLSRVEDNLRMLGELELGQLASQLTVGEGAIILSPNRATMIPVNLLLPEQLGGSNTIAVDQRFRGEQIISSAMRSLQSEVLPTVVFVHAEKKSLLWHHSNNIDVSAVRGLLEASRIGVQEWIPSDGQKPVLGAEPVVWVIIPPSNRAGLELSPREQKLLLTTRNLLAAGESVLINLHPSLLPRYGQDDPWATLVESIGISADTERALVERVAVGPNKLDIERGQIIIETNSNHLIARAVNGRQIYFPLPIALRGGEALIVVNPSEDRWLDQQWERPLVENSNQKPMEEDIAIATAVELQNGTRAVVVGSGGWLLSWVADRVVSVGGNQVSIVNPGNSELLLASVEWLAGLDNWIAASPIGQQSARIQNLSNKMYLAWAGILVLGIPLLLLASATIFSLGRNSR